MADVPAVAACAEIKYEKLAAMYMPSGYSGKKGTQAYGRAYLQKIIQLQFDMPAHARLRIGKLIEELVGGSPARPAPEPEKQEKWK